MSSRPFRRANFISPFGPGAISVAPDGTATLTAGLDHWYDPPPNGNAEDYDVNEFIFHEWRLERELEIEHLRLPPDYRKRSRKPNYTGEAEVNLGMQIPMLRFPKWHVCTNLKCQTLRELPMTVREQPTCLHCSSDFKRPRPMIQVQFITICEKGHIQDFPWREWVHRSNSPTCDGRLHFYGTGGATLSARHVKCDCGKNRDLSGIVGRVADPSDSNSEESRPLTHLSAHLSADGEPHLCRGTHPWLGENEGRGCGEGLYGTLRGATNVYFPIVKSSIYLPLKGESAPSKLSALLDREDVRAVLGTIKRLQPNAALHETRYELRQSLPNLLDAKFTDEEIERALEVFELGATSSTSDTVAGDLPETSFRRAEHKVLRETLDTEDLKVHPVSPAQYEESISRYFSRVQLVKTLRETRVFTGFSRLRSIEGFSREERITQLWKHPQTNSTNWLPAYNVFGEGLYLELNEDLVRDWEHKTGVANRIGRLDQRYQRLVEERSYADLDISPRFVLLHTLAHILINQLVFDCGYSSASLRERLYVSDNPDAPMAGILIYTASGDSDGTMGGVVRMGQPGFLEPVITSAIGNATWCSSDPVCMELGGSGQGPDSCNLAACHSCGLLPETSCERFNRFLDRWTLVGSPENPTDGFFSDLIKTGPQKITVH